MPGDVYRWTPRKTDTTPGLFNTSRVLLVAGIVTCLLATLSSVLALALPYWIYVSDTMETTVAGLTDATEVTYFYGLAKYCLMMKATHLNIDECGDKPLSSLKTWERLTLLTLVVGLVLLVVTMTTILMNLLCWNKRFFLINATVSAVCSGVCTSVGVSVYQMRASVQTLSIGGGLASADFRPEFLHVGFWLGFTSAAATLLASCLVMAATFTWRKPAKPRMVHGGKYKTTVRPERCPYKGRQPAIISVTQM